MLVYKFQLMEYRGIFAYTFYASRTSRVVYKRLLNLDDISEFVYNFKRYGKDARRIETLVGTIKEHFSCSDIVVIPPSKVEKENVFQSIYGSKLVRKFDIPPRKYDREKKVQLDYSSSLEVKKELIIGKKILLVDDICTTGKTIFECLSILKDFTVIPFVLAFSNTLQDRVSMKEYIYIYEDIKTVKVDSMLFDSLQDLERIGRKMQKG